MDSLPREVIDLIFMAAADVRCAARLGQANKRLHEVWTASQEQILSAVLRSDIVALDEALHLARASRARLVEFPSSLHIQLASLVPLLKTNAQQCSLVCKLWEAQYLKIALNRPWSEARAASHYYRSREATIAYQSRMGRLQIRRRLNKLSDDDIQELTAFIVWWVMQCSDQSIRDVHDMGMTDTAARAAGLEWDEAQYCKPDKWCWAVETISLLNMRRIQPDQEIGDWPKMYSDACGYGYQSDWW